MPPTDGGEHLIEHLFAIGPSTAGEAITFQEIAAWLDLTGHQLDGWEVETLRRLSGTYLSELQAAEEADRPPPFRPAERVLTRSEVSQTISDIFARLEARDAKLARGA